jgi:hypothetical protein
LDNHATADGKQVITSDEDAPKTAVLNLAESEETNPKFGYTHDDRAGSGIETARQYAPLRGGGDNHASNGAAFGPTIGNGNQATDQWHFGFWECYKPGGLREWFLHANELQSL